MIKISKDYLSLQTRVFPLGTICIYIIVVYEIINTGLWMVCLGFAAIALLHFFATTIWKRFLLSDVYVNCESNEVAFKNLNDFEETFNRKQVVKIFTYFGITTVSISYGDKIIKKYFMVNYEDNLNYLDDGFQNSGDKLYYLENPLEKRTMEVLKNYKKLLLIPFVTMPLLALIAYISMTRYNHKILGYEFNGKVDSVWYDGNRSDKIVTEPTVFIHGESYNLDYHTWGFRRNIQPGDSLIKLKNTFTVTLVKRNGKKIVYQGD